jgi:UDP-GlcNAc:undecaprenyl-phosphate GlcNAc-1-phosphate transferase
MSNPFADNLLYFDQIQLNVPILNLQITLIADLVLIFWIVMLMNTTNWTKGASQLPGVAVIAFITLAAVALKYQAGNPYQLQTALLSIIMAGAVLAFLPFNFPPERMFPGFGASTFIGFMLAVLSVLSGGKFATIAIVFAIPIIDALLVGLRRIRSGKSPLQNDREHFYHLLLNKGYRKRFVIVIYWISSLIFAFSAYYTYGTTKIMVLGILTIIFSLILFFLYRKK